jgi:RNA polymerase sigma-70 factor (ECF subfamily)
MDSVAAARAQSDLRPARGEGPALGAEEIPASGCRPAGSRPADDLKAFEAIYDEHLAFVWRSLRRLGVRDAALDDAVQDVFLVVHRRLPEFEGRSSIKTWLFGIVLRVSRTCRRTARRKSPEAEAPGGPEDPEGLADARGHGPDELAEKSEAVRTLYELLDELGEDKREVFVLAELEQMTAPEISEALGANLNSVYSRLRAARRDFEQAVARRRARDGWRHR